MVNVGEGDAIDACNFVTKPTDTEYCETHRRGREITATTLSHIPHNRSTYNNHNPIKTSSSEKPTTVFLLHSTL